MDNKRFKIKKKKKTEHKTQRDNNFILQQLINAFFFKPTKTKFFSSGILYIIYSNRFLWLHNIYDITLSLYTDLL